MRIWRFVAGLTALTLLGACAWLWTPDIPREDLEAKYLRDRTDYREVAGIRLHVRDDGPAEAPAIVLLHGFGSSLHTWEDWAQGLKAEYRVIRYDLPGYGLTGADPENDYSTARGIEILAALLDKYEIRRATLIGNSLGGRLAWRFAAARPERVEKLVLIAPDGFASAGFEYDTAPDVSPVVRVMRYVLPRPILRMNLEPAYADPGVLSDATVTRYHDLIRAPGVRGAMIAQMEQLRLMRPEPLLATIEAPTLLLWGAEDRVIPASHAADYLRVMPEVELVVLPGLGHVPQEEAPDISLQPIRQFLAN